MHSHRVSVIALRETPLPRVGYLVVELRRSRDFWDTPTLIDEAWERYGEACGALAIELADDWGPAEQIDLGTLLYGALDGDPPPLADDLAEYVPHVFAWHFADRTVCVGVGQHDKEFPVVLIAAVGTLVDASR